MTNLKKSFEFNLTRCAFFVPVLVALLLVFSISKAAPPLNEKENKTTGKTMPATKKEGAIKKGGYLSEKMILIDGKEATEHDLNSTEVITTATINIKSGPALTKKYGDKAKNGVVFITTKKDAK